MHVMKRSAGFTLVEMIIAVAILGIMAAIAMPSFSTFIRNAQIRSAVENMQAGLNLARSEALRRNTRVSLWMVNGISATCARSASGTSWVVSLADPAGKCNIVSSETVAPQLVQSRSGSDGTGTVGVSAVTGGGAASSCITFNGFGQVEAACTGGGTPVARVVFAPAAATAGVGNLEVRVTPGGAIRSCNPAKSGEDPTKC